MIKLPDEKPVTNEMLMCDNIENNGWNLCLAEVKRLNATAQPVSDGWVKCSERMPENSDAVLVCQEGEITFCAEYDDGEFYPDEFPNLPKQGKEITHWMPMPAAPGDQDE